MQGWQQQKLVSRLDEVMTEEQIIEAAMLIAFLKDDSNEQN